MTVLAPALDHVVAPVARRGPGSRPASWPSRSELVEHASVGLALVWWAVPLTHGTGGREPWRLVVALALLVPAWAATRPWSRAPRTALVLGLALPLAALGVATLAPAGWRGMDVAGYAYPALLLPVLLTYLVTPARRLAVAGLVALAGLDQFSQAFLPWWGGGDPAHPMVGTFYWHNQYAAFLLPAALISLAAVVGRARPVALIGWVAAPLCAAGVVFSTSRASVAALAVGWVALALCVPFAARTGARGLARGVAVSALAAIVLVVLPGPPLFAHSASPLAGISERSGGGQSLAANGGYRLDFWREAVVAAEHHPLVGGGFHSLATVSTPLVPASWPRSPYAHNGLLQAAADGGFLLAGPLWAAFALVAVGLLRRLRYAVRAPVEQRWLAVAAPLAGLALLAHALVDFDWSYPALFALAALVCALGLRTGAMPGRSGAVTEADPAAAA